MKRLTLLRHAKSSWDDRDLQDHDRPLAKRGLRDAPHMGGRLAARGLKPDLVLTSTALRARKTAELVTAAFGRADLVVELEPRIYLATPGELLDVLSGLSDELGDVVLVGHNPGLTQLANMILPSLRLHNLPTAGAVAVNCETDRWRNLDSASFSLRFNDYPKNPEPPA